MSIAPSLPSYSELTRALKKTESAFEAAQVHGLLCGFICVNSGEMNNAWEELVVGPKKNQQSLSLLQELYELSYHEISEFSFEFSLLLPSDKIDINDRTETLGLWCQGFLAGLEQAQDNIQSKPRVSAEVAEAINDLVEIAKVNFGDIASTEEDEMAYFELVEYVRLAVIMIFHELTSGNIQDNESEDSSLH